MNKKKEGKITLGMLKGKPVTTSVPSISIKFHANAEQLEELYASDEEHPASSESLGPSAGTSEPESSPLKYLPRLVKRSTSIDITPTTTIDASPPSDPWRFFSDIKGKITKSVEEKITEIKSRNQEEGSPLKGKTVKDSKDNSSVSDSEDLSESSISKTCGIVSTTEGAEMSSDEDTPSIEKDKKTEDRSRGSGANSDLRHRFRLLKPKSTREGAITRTTLVKLYNINTDKIEQALPEESEIESAVDALEDSNLQEHQGQYEKDVLKGLADQFDNIKIDNEDVLIVKEVQGNEVKQLHWASKSPKVVFAPVGFVDMRPPPVSVQRMSFKPAIAILILAVMYFLLYKYSSYIAGFMIGVIVTFMFFHFKSLLDSPVSTAHSIPQSQDILEIPAVQEYQPFTKYEGWVNEFPDTYNPKTYHISQTQSVFLRLQGNLLRISHTRSKVPKRALWNESKVKPIFTHHRVYNLLGAKVSLLPEGLAKKRHWSKKYPICITLGKDQMQFEAPVVTSSGTRLDEEEEQQVKTVDTTKKPPKKTFGFVKKKKYPVLTQRFSKLTEENEEYELDSENSRASTPSPPSPDMSEENGGLTAEDVTNQIVEQALSENLRVCSEEFEDDDVLADDWGTFTPPEESPTETRLYLFGRTDREKEDWFRRLAAATHKGADLTFLQSCTLEGQVSRTLIDLADTDMNYIKFMLNYNKTGKQSKNDSNESSEETSSPGPDIQWINAFVGRILFDCLRDDTFTEKVKDKIQRKLGSIKLPYFIEELLVTELTLGHTPPLIHKATKPVLDDRGLWVDLDITYEGEVVLILQTKLNLMKLKQPHANEGSRNSDRPAMFNSDVEDSAESTSDEEPVNLPHHQSSVLDANGLPIQGLGGSSNTSKKFMKMVDKIAESKFFQAATEYRYIKKAMEGVSNTDLRLRVEIKELVGTLVLNIPPPPSDRVWVGFRPTPDLGLSAQPIVGERNITFLRIISWIEKKLIQEFQKLLVIPNMEDFIIPVMSPKLPL